MSNRKTFISRVEYDASNNCVYASLEDCLTREIVETKTIRPNDDYSEEDVWVQNVCSIAWGKILSNEGAAL
jgi:hypothetical protein